jgi:hypothetical protein
VELLPDKLQSAPVDTQLLRIFLTMGALQEIAAMSCAGIGWVTSWFTILTLVVATEVNP